MKTYNDRPDQPFVYPDGSPRIRSEVGPEGIIEYRPGQVLVDLSRIDGAREDPDLARRLVEEVAGTDVGYDDASYERAKSTGFLLLRFADPSADVLSAIRVINAKFESSVASVNTVFKVGALTSSPMYLSPMYLSPMYLSPMYLSAQYGGDPERFRNTSTARPAVLTDDALPQKRNRAGSGSADVAIVDTGVPIEGLPAPSDVDFRGTGDGVRDQPDMNADGYLDIAAGHSTFIRTIIERASPTAQFLVEGVMENDGDGDETAVADALIRIDEHFADKSQLIVNLSFGAYYPGDVAPPLIACAIRKLVDQGAVVVAAAGNDGSCRPKFPAAMPEVLSVSAMGPCGPAAFSNHGHWVDVCAPGEDLISEFFDNFDGAFEPLPGSNAPDFDDFSGWAMWSGTSFATPAVVGALAELIEIHDCSAIEAVQRLVTRTRSVPHSGLRRRRQSDLLRKI